METKTMTLDAIEDLAYRALTAAGTDEKAARSLALATRATEADGIASHGLAYIPTYCSHVTCGKVDGQAEPRATQPKPGLTMVDAATGFAHPAIDLGFESLIPNACTQGVAALSLYNSYNCGVLGYHTYRLAQKGLLGIGFTNAPASIAPSGGAVPVVGTNPFSIAVPGEDGAVAILIDQSASTIAKSEVMKHANEGEPIPLGWALDPSGAPTTDPAIGLKGSMAPSGGYKGVGIALMVEILAAAFSGAHLGTEAAPFSGIAGGPPKTGQFFLAIDPGAHDGAQFAAKIQALLASFEADPNARLPGRGRASKRKTAEADGIAVSVVTLDKINAVFG